MCIQVAACHIAHGDLYISIKLKVEVECIKFVLHMIATIAAIAEENRNDHMETTLQKS